MALESAVELFRMASNTKPAIATAVLILADDGKLQIEVARFGEIGPEEEPATTYSYSNPGFNTLGAIIEVVSGKPLDLYLKERIYDPLGMHNSLNHESKSDHSRMSKVYTRRDGEWTARWSPGDEPDYPFVRASGGMISTAWDYAIFGQMYLNSGVYDGARILSRESVELATARQTWDIYTEEELESRNSFYGYGWNVSTDDVFSHGGSDGTFAWVDPNLEIIGLVFTQSPRGGSNPRNEFRDLVTGAVIDSAADPVGESR